MKYSEIALKVLTAKECGIIKTNAHFWKNYADRKSFEEEISKYDRFEEMNEKILNEYELSDREIGIVSVFDDEFPHINPKVKNNSEKPFLLFYKGNYSLMGDLNNNVAVIGMRDPDKDIIERESVVVKEIIENRMVIVSGLALGCDTVAHRICVVEGGKTIAILPSQINNIYPSDNLNLSEEIVDKGGLLLSEYYKEPIGKREAISRFVERDRLQAMFAKAVILIASYRKGDGESGSRHAMEAAGKYGIDRYVMYNSDTDKDNIKFGLNRDLVNQNDINKAEILNNRAICKIMVASI